MLDEQRDWCHLGNAWEAEWARAVARPRGLSEPGAGGGSFAGDRARLAGPLDMRARVSCCAAWGGLSLLIGDIAPFCLNIVGLGLGSLKTQRCLLRTLPSASL